MSSYDPNFSLITSFAYHSQPLDSSAVSSLISKHHKRLSTAHHSLASSIPSCWCATTQPPSEEDVATALNSAIKEARERSVDGDLRVRISVPPPKRGKAFGEVWPLTPMPNYPVKLVFDDGPTEYEGDPFMLSKTTNRSKYDDCRKRLGATLSPSNETNCAPFDVVMFNPRNEITETTISNLAFKLSGDNPRWITPRLECGLLPGTKREELLKDGTVVEGIVRIDQMKRAQKDGTLKVICFNGVRGVFDAFVEIKQ
ncbi:hypothetical protein JCM5353_000083 [Sporobolomyces roseus]